MILGIIPARMASSRFPGKPLSPIHGIPMAGHVFLRGRMCSLLDEVCVATCDEEIAEYVRAIGGHAVMTADTHQRASDRAAEAMLQVEEETGKRVTIAVMIQGDEPMLLPEMVESAVRPLLEDESLQVVNLAAPLKSEDEARDPNEVKVVMDRQNNALYFSRAAVPTRVHGKADTPCYKQVCIIPFRRDYLIRFNALPPTPLEEAESVDMLRVLEHGGRVKMVPGDWGTLSVDTPQDLKNVEASMVRDARQKACLLSYQGQAQLTQQAPGR